MSATLAALAAKGFPAIADKLAATYAARAIDTTPRAITMLRQTIEPHVRDTFSRCSEIKTLLHPLTPVNLLSIYATQRFRHGASVIDHYAAVEYIKSGPQNVLITGTGGSGKSIFTKYLWLSLFLDGDGRIPLFIELRSLNSISTIDIAAYLFYTVTR